MEETTDCSDGHSVGCIAVDFGSREPGSLCALLLDLAFVVFAGFVRGALTESLLAPILVDAMLDESPVASTAATSFVICRLGGRSATARVIGGRGFVSALQIPIPTSSVSDRRCCRRQIGSGSISALWCRAVSSGLLVVFLLGFACVRLQDLVHLVVVLFCCSFSAVCVRCSFVLFWKCKSIIKYCCSL
jgi:hypothetical protein